MIRSIMFMLTVVMLELFPILTMASPVITMHEPVCQECPPVINISGVATFPSSGGIYKGAIRFYVDNAFPAIIEKLCTEEICAFDYNSITGSFFAINKGNHVLRLQAIVGGNEAVAEKNILVDDTPSINMSEPSCSNCDPLINVTGQAKFKPFLSNVKGSIRFYVDTAYVPALEKQCTTEICFFDYQQLTGHLYELSKGQHTVKLTAIHGGSAADASKVINIDDTPSINMSEPSCSNCDRFINVTGQAKFKPSLSSAKGSIRFYVDTAYVPTLEMQCTTEICSFDYQQLTGHLYELSKGQHTVKLTAIHGGSTANDIREIFVCEDNDRDGYFNKLTCPVGDDCNDSDPAIHPDATELCDNKDNNCNGQTDEPKFKDDDRDAYPVQVAGCPVPGLYDCNDNDAKIYPNAPEICNDLKDNNCNGVTDESCKRDRCAEVPM